MRRTLAIVAVAAAFVAAGSALASPDLNIGQCLKYTNAQALRATQILKGLPLTSAQVREVRSRLAQYNSVRGYPGIDDLGLPADVVAEINRRIQVQVAEWNKHPLGYPCLPFKSSAKTKVFARRLLLDNGFRVAGLSIRKTSPRQFQFQGIRDGTQMFGIIVKTAPRQVAIFVESVTPRFSQTRRFTTPFEA